MKNNFPREDQYYATRECKQFFDLFSKLIDEYFSFGAHPKFEGEQMDLCALTEEVFKKMRFHDTKEKKTSILEDKTLIGYMDLLKKLIVYIAKTPQGPAMMAMFKGNHFLDEMYYENLFYHPVYTKAVTQQKCKCKESRASAFSLLQAYFEALDPRDLSEYLDQYLWPFIKDFVRPKKWQY
mmetsp:Transcript_23126/g.22590  ORF Transcript_23126/g.22590 Transcript_23126/m.22590 type:complete len:181 (+) Transcript_23126:170-712(+)